MVQSPFMVISMWSKIKTPQTLPYEYIYLTFKVHLKIIKGFGFLDCYDKQPRISSIIFFVWNYFLDFLYQIATKA